MSRLPVAYRPPVQVMAEPLLYFNDWTVNRLLIIILTSATALNSGHYNEEKRGKSIVNRFKADITTLRSWTALLQRA